MRGFFDVHVKNSVKGLESYRNLCSETCFSTLESVPSILQLAIQTRYLKLVLQRFPFNLVLPLLDGQPWDLPGTNLG